VRKKVTRAAKKAKTGEAVTAVVGGVAAAAGLQKVLSLLDETRRQKPMFEKQIEAIQNQVGALEKQIAGSEPEHEVV
jgi:peptidoglycan hydrolase CwlO-like protein